MGGGDPAMVVEKDPSTGKAVEALYPDDPSNVHHSYLGEPVRFRNIHVGAETHVFHLHAHQWLQSPRDQNSTYLDSQTISPGASFTYEINYGGSGNRNFTVGDSIFHCHLYPHFARGMWELWRVHDVFEAGTPDRNLPDAEIAGGTPNPALFLSRTRRSRTRRAPPLTSVCRQCLPKSSRASRSTSASSPGDNLQNLAGHRPPQAPINIERDGGLPRHRIKASTVIDGPAAIEPALLNDPVAARVLSQNNDPNLLAFARKLVTANIELLPNDGTSGRKEGHRFPRGSRGGNPLHNPVQLAGEGFPVIHGNRRIGSFPRQRSPGQAGSTVRGPLPGYFQTKRRLAIMFRCAITARHTSSST